MKKGKQMSKTVKNRLKSTRPVLATRAEMEEAMSQVRLLTLRRNKVQLDRERAVKEIDDAVAGPLEEISARLGELTALLEQWAGANAEAFGGKQTLETIHGLLGWRIGQPQLKTMRGTTWDEVIEALRDLGLFGYVRTKAEVNKQAILGDREAIGPDKLALLKLKVEQAEPFFVEPKIEEVENTLKGN